MWEIFLISAFLVLIIDQSVKFIVVKSQFPFYLNKWGPAGSYKKYPWLKTVELLIHILILVPLFIYSNNLYLSLGVGLIAGGLSNSLDRHLYGGVVDFIPLPIKVPNHPYPSRFNLADFSILIGIIFYITEVIKFRIY